MVSQSNHELGEVAQLIVLQRADGAVLLLENVDGRWNLPGGRLERGETWLAGLQREIFEETGICSFALTGLLTVYQRMSRRTQQPVYGVVFRGTTDESGVVLSEEHRSYRWIESVDACDGMVFYLKQIEEAVRAVLTKEDIWKDAFLAKK